MVNRGNQLSAISSQRGASLIEVMVAVAILAIGLLGLTNLQAASLRASHSAYMRTQATNLAYDMSDRMRTNREAALAGEYLIELDDDTPDEIQPPVLSNQDLRGWRDAIAGTLPNGTGAVERAGDLFIITIQWTDDRDDADPQEFAMRTEI